jgi:hypothetical protein
MDFCFKILLHYHAYHALLIAAATHALLLLSPCRCLVPTAIVITNNISPAPLFGVITNNS